MRIDLLIIVAGLLTLLLPTTLGQGGTPPTPVPNHLCCEPAQIGGFPPDVTCDADCETGGCSADPSVTYPPDTSDSYCRHSDNQYCGTRMGWQPIGSTTVGYECLMFGGGGCNPGETSCGWLIVTTAPTEMSEFDCASWYNECD